MASIAPIKAKVQRAKKHICDLASEIRGFLDNNPNQVIANADQKTGERVFRLKIVRDPPIIFGLITGDVIHNLRSALDHLAWQLVDANGGKPSKKTAFPILEGCPVDYEARIEGILKGASADAINLVKSFHPYKGGNEVLYTLHRLDITDKHRLLITIGTAHTGITVYTGPSASSVPRGMPRVFVPTELWPPVGTFPLKDGAELARINPADFGAHREVYMNPQFTIQIAFGESGMFQGEPLIPSLHQLSYLVDSMVDIFFTNLPELRWCRSSGGKAFSIRIGRASG